MKFQICKIGPPLDFSETLDIFKIPNRKSSETGFCIILGDHYLNYKNALRYLQCETLKDRQKKLGLNFAKKSLKHPKYQNWFVPNAPKSDTWNNTLSLKQCQLWIIASKSSSRTSSDLLLLLACCRPDLPALLLL